MFDFTLPPLRWGRGALRDLYMLRREVFVECLDHCTGLLRRRLLTSGLMRPLAANGHAKLRPSEMNFQFR